MTGDWADEKAYEIWRGSSGMGNEECMEYIAAVLRKTRDDTLEDAAQTLARAIRAALSSQKDNTT